MGYGGLSFLTACIIMYLYIVSTVYYGFTAYVEHLQIYLASTFQIGAWPHLFIAKHCVEHCELLEPQQPPVPTGLNELLKHSGTLFDGLYIRPCACISCRAYKLFYFALQTPLETVELSARWLIPLCQRFLLAPVVDCQQLNHKV